MRMEWAKEKADAGCEKLARYLKTRVKDENMFLSASNRNSDHKIALVPQLSGKKYVRCAL